jgi:hypothetical protein
VKISFCLTYFNPSILLGFIQFFLTDAQASSYSAGIADPDRRTGVVEVAWLCQELPMRHDLSVESARNRGGIYCFGVAWICLDRWFHQGSDLSQRTCKEIEWFSFSWNLWTALSLYFKQLWTENRCALFLELL